MAYVNVPKDLTKVKNKVILNLTIRQIVCMGVSIVIAIPLFFILHNIIGNMLAIILMMFILVPGFLFGMYEKDGMGFEYVVRHMLNVIYLRPKTRRYETVNYYSHAKVTKAKAKTANKAKTTTQRNSPVQNGLNILNGGNNRQNSNRKKDGEQKKPFPLFGMKKEDKITAQDSIRYEEISRDGICRLEKGQYSKTIRFYDITYQLAQAEDRTAIFEAWCEFLNYFDSTIHVQFSFVNHHSGISTFRDAIKIEMQGDRFDEQRKEFAQVLEDQLEKGNNGLVKSKYITFTIEAKNYKEAKPRLERIETDVLNNFKVIGVAAYPLNGAERLGLLYETFNPETDVPFNFNFDWLTKNGLRTKDYVAPSSFQFRTGRNFQMGDTWGAVSWLQLMASEFSDKMLAEFLESEDDLIVTLQIHPVEQQRAIKLVKGKMSDINKMKIEEQKKAVRSGYDMTIIPSDLNTYSDEAEKLLEDLQSRNERMFMVTVLFMSTAKTKEELDNAVFQLSGIASKYNCVLKNADFLQEEGVMSSVPLGRNDIPIERGLTTTSTAVFVPFTTQELFMGGESVYYGLNTLSSNMIMANRKELKNPNGLIFGTPGSGKSFAAKREIMNVFCVTQDDIIICDPEAEYGPLVEALGGQCIHISSSSHDYINPLDINMDYSDEDNPLSVKSDFILSMYELMLDVRGGVPPEEKSVLDRCLPLVYKKYFEDPCPENMPILSDLYNVLMRQDEPEAKHIATILELYVNGSLNVFNHQTNVEMNNRIICFDTKDLGKQLKKLGMLIVQDQVWNRVTQNRGTSKATWYYIDEFHLLLKEEQTAAYSGEIWKRFRKWGGIPTGITQNVKDLLASKEIENIFENSDFILMLNQRGEDREILARHLNISPNQLSYVTNSNEGEGLLFYGSVIIPFRDHFDKDTNLYKLMSTKPAEMAEMTREEEEEAKFKYVIGSSGDNEETEIEIETEEDITDDNDAETSDTDDEESEVDEKVSVNAD